MTPLIVILALFLDAVYGAAHPAITPAARLADRQNLGIVVVWSPVVSGGDVSYGMFSFSSQSVTSAASFWNWCSLGQTGCLVGTSCASGTIYYPGTTIACAATANRCATEYLFSSSGARSGLTRPACFGQGATTLAATYFIVSPTAGAAITTSTPQPGIITSIPAASRSSSSSTSTSPSASSPAPPPPSPSTPIGAIVGGVMGGLAAVAIAAAAIFFLFRRRRREAGAAAPPTDVSQHNFPSTQPQPPTTTYDNKHASVVSQYPQTPGSPPPMYQNPAGQNWNAYAMHGSVQVNEMPANTAAGPRPGVAESMGASHQSQAQYRNPNPATHEMPTA